MTSDQKNWFVIIGVSVPATILCAAFLISSGVTDENLRLLLRLTARIAFIVYLIVFVARPLQQLVAISTTRWLLRERRSFGLTFVSIHTVHAALILYLAKTSADFDFVPSENLLGAGIYVLILLMAITSFDGPARALGPVKWRRLHKTGLYVIGLTFLQTLLPGTKEELFEPERTWLIILTGGAVFIRLTAFFATRKKSS